MGQLYKWWDFTLSSKYSLCPFIYNLHTYFYLPSTQKRFSVSHSPPPPSQSNNAMGQATFCKCFSPLSLNHIEWWWSQKALVTYIQVGAIGNKIFPYIVQRRDCCCWHSFTFFCLKKHENYQLHKGPSRNDITWWGIILGWHPPLNFATFRQTSPFPANVIESCGSVCDVISGWALTKTRL